MFGVIEAVTARYIYTMLYHWGISNPLVLENTGLPTGANIPSWFRSIEALREACSYILIILVAIISCRSWQEFSGTFLLLFGFWDLSYYLDKMAIFQGPGIILRKDYIFIFPFSLWLPTYIPIFASILFILGGYILLKRSVKNRSTQI